MARRIVITSGKGGVGKTTVCANLGYALAKKGLKVLLIDGDIGLNNLDVVMGIEGKVIYDLNDVVCGKCRPRQAIIQDSFEKNLFVFASNRANFYFDSEGECIKDVIDQLDEYFDYIIIDSPAGIENGFYRIIKCANEIIVVTTPHLSSIRDADKVINILKIHADKVINGIIVNKIRGDLVVRGQMLDIDNIAKYLKLNIIGAIPDDDYVAFQLMTGGKLNKNSNSKDSFKLIAETLHSGRPVIYNCTKKFKGVLGNLRAGLRKWIS